MSKSNHTGLESTGTNNSEPRSELSESTIEQIHNRDNHECQYCGVGGPVASLEIHHILPVSEGGANNKDNLVTLCERCHKAVHRLSALKKCPIKVLEMAEMAEINQPNSPDIIQDKYSHSAPKNWSQEEWISTIGELDVPAKVYLNIKTIKENDYYYFQWREQDKIKSEYIGPVDPR
jgi:ferredoxin